LSFFFCAPIFAFSLSRDCPALRIACIFELFNSADSKILSFEISPAIVSSIARQSLESEKAKIGAQKKKLKDERDGIPSRIDELDRMSGDTFDFKQLENNLSIEKTTLAGVDKEINDVNESLDGQREKITAAKDLKWTKEQALKQLERNLSEVPTLLEETDANNLQAAKLSLSKTTQEINSINSLISSWELQVEAFETAKSDLLSEWSKINSSTAPIITENETACPSCKRELENVGEIKENLIANFNTSKTNNLKVNQGKGLAVVKQLEELKLKINEAKPTLKPLNESKEIHRMKTVSLTSIINAPKEAPQPTADMIALKKEIESIVIPTIEAPNTQELQAKKNEIEERISVINRSLGTKEQIEKNKARMIELQEQQKNLSQQIADLEKTEFQIDAFNKAKINLVESRINSKFKLVKFKMFEQQLNGGESPACECLVDGVPFKGLNTASQINAGLDVINGLQEHFKILAPVFIDHRESVFQLQPMSCQLVGLMADETAKKLIVTNQ